MPHRLELLTPAKINLFLRVVGRRPDGYHQLDSIFVPVTFFDRIILLVEPSSSRSVALSCSAPGLPLDSRNLAVRAAVHFMETFNLSLNVNIGLEKRIFTGAGLGGGSSDAAAVLRMMARLHPQGQATMRQVALELGADVPFFLEPRPARVGGIGELIQPLGTMPALHLVIAAPDAEISTTQVYRALRPEDFSGPAPGETLTRLAAGEVAVEMLVNDLEAAAIAICPAIGETKAILDSVGARGTAMSGSGSAVFGLFADAERANWAAQRIARQFRSVRSLAAQVAFRPEEIKEEIA